MSLHLLIVINNYSQLLQVVNDYEQVINSYY